MVPAAAVSVPGCTSDVDVDAVALAGRALVAWRVGARVLAVSLPDLRVDTAGTMTDPEHVAMLFARQMADRFHCARPPRESSVVWADDEQDLRDLAAGSDVEHVAALMARAVLAEHRPAMLALARRIEAAGLLFADELDHFAQQHGLTGRGHHPYLDLRRWC